MEEKEIKAKTQEEIDSEYQYDNGFQPKEVKLKENYKFYPRGLFYMILRRTIVLLSELVLLFPKLFIWGYRVKGRKNIKYIKGTPIVCNHAFTFDAFSIVGSLWFKTINVTMLQSNLGFGIASKYFRGGGGVPIPTENRQMIRFLKETKETLKRGKNILIYPEAMLMPFCDHIRAFKPGAFHIAVNNTDKIIIMLHTFHKPRGLYKLVRRKKPCIHLNILEPYYIKKEGSKKEIIEKCQNDIHQIMVNYFNEHSDYFKK